MRIARRGFSRLKASACSGTPLSSPLWGAAVPSVPGAASYGLPRPSSPVLPQLSPSTPARLGVHPQSSVMPQPCGSNRQSDHKVATDPPARRPGDSLAKGVYENNYIVGGWSKDIKTLTAEPAYRYWNTTTDWNLLQNYIKIQPGGFALTAQIVTHSGQSTFKY